MHLPRIEHACIADVKPDAATETELIEVLERFCSGFADRDAEAVLRLFVPDHAGVTLDGPRTARRRAPLACGGARRDRLQVLSVIP
jgi:hypothetical protein